MSERVEITLHRMALLDRAEPTTYEATEVNDIVRAAAERMSRRATGMLLFCHDVPYSVAEVEAILDAERSGRLG